MTNLYPPTREKSGDVKRKKSWFSTGRIFGAGRIRGFILLGIAVVMAIVGVFVMDPAKNAEVEGLTGVVESVTEDGITMTTDDGPTLITLDDDILIELQDGGQVDATTIIIGRELEVMHGIKQEDGSILALEVEVGHPR